MLFSETILQKLKKWKNLSYVLMGVAVLIMICIAAANYQTGFRSDARPKYQSINQASGILFGCPSLTEGFLLTFDDSPMSDVDELLNVLKPNNVTALFFFSIEKLQRSSQIAEKILRDGHELGISVHDGDGSSNSAEIFQKNIKAAELAMINATNVTPRFLRPFNKTIDKAHLKAASSMGYTVVMWNAVAKDIISENENGMKYLSINYPRLGGILRLPEISKYYNNWLKDLFQQGYEPFISTRRCFGIK